MNTPTKIKVKYIPSISNVWVHRYISPPSLDYLKSINKMFTEVFWK